MTITRNKDNILMHIMLYRHTKRKLTFLLKFNKVRGDVFISLGRLLLLLNWGGELLHERVGGGETSASIIPL